LLQYGKGALTLPLICELMLRVVAVIFPAFGIRVVKWLAPVAALLPVHFVQFLLLVFE